jgi:ATP/maltotriose-dependent transcriptional regulator MalT
VRQVSTGLAVVGVLVQVHRGQYDEASRMVDVYAPLQTSADLQEQACYGCGKAALLLARGDAEAALRLAEAAFDVRETMGISVEYIKEAFAIAVQAALELGDVDTAESLIATVEGLPAGRSPQLLRAQADRFKALLAAQRNDAGEAERLFKNARRLFRELAIPFYVAVSELEQSEWLVAQGRGHEAEAMLAEAREIFERLDARPWLERLTRISPHARESQPVPAGS